ncbi:AvrE-family type 3 secretion system effector [Pseudomonas syringae]|uniref:AvrE-family type 3 secretion system effector n=2 Tax=Pseudomonas syringae TaxID=317 RepID=A0AAU8LIZ9_PSESX
MLVNSPHRNTGLNVQPEAVASTSTNTDLQQRARRPTQGCAHSLSTIGRRMAHGVGKLFQKPHPPRQTATGMNNARITSTPTRTPVPGSASRSVSSSGYAPGSESESVSASTSAYASGSGYAPGSESSSVSGSSHASEPEHSLRSVSASASSSAPASLSGYAPDSESVSTSASALSRSNAGRFEIQQDRLERLAQPQNTIALGLNGQADFTTFSPPGVGPLLNSVLAKPGQTYLAHDSRPDASQHLLLESDGHLLHLDQQSDSLSLIRSSSLIPNLQGGDPLTVSLQSEAGQVQVNAPAGNATHGLPGKAHIAHITGVHQGPDGQRMRVHEDRLYEFDQDSASWKAPEGTEDIAFNALAMGGNGAVYAKSDDVLVDLSSPLMPRLEAKDLKSFSVAPDNTVALLSGDDVQSILLADMSPGIGGAKRQKVLELDGGQSEAAAVGLSADRLFVADTQGRIYSADRQAFESDDPLLRLMPEREHYLTAGGSHHMVTGFISGDDGRVHALIQDRAGIVHSHALDEQRAQLDSGWNLTDALVLDNVRGLTQTTDPAPADRLNLDRSGLVAINAGRIQRWDATPQAWKDTDIKDIDQLQRGADSNAYVLKGGKLHKLDVSPEYHKAAFGSTSSLAQAPRSTKVAMGKEIEGLDDRLIKAFAMVNDKQFVALDDQGRLTAHHKDRKPVDLGFPGLSGDIKTLALDEKHNLHALTSTGELFRLPKDIWQAAKPADHPEASWTPVASPNGQPVVALYSNDDNFLSAKVEDAAGDGLLQLKSGNWQAAVPRPVEQNGLNDLFSRITGTLKTKRIPGTGGTARMDINVLGRSGMEKGNRATTKEFVRANIYKNTLETPRWMKNVGDYVQHSYQGREGLRPVYNCQSTVFKQLELIHETGETPPAAGNDLKARIARLDLGPAGADLVKDLEAFRDELEKHTYTALVDIGQGYGQFKSLRQRDGVLNLHGELAEPSKRTEMGKKLSELKATLNFKNSGHDLVKELQDALTQIAPSAENRTGQLLEVLKDNGLKISHQKADIPLGQRRDKGDELALSKARLALDVVTLKSISTLLDQLELVGPGSDLGPLQEKLTHLKETTYGENPVKQVTDMGFTNHATLESSYDAVKAFMKSFKKADHATSVNLRAASGAKDQAELAANLKATLKQLEHADDEISIQRSYGLNFTSPFTVLANKGQGPWPTASATGNRNYIMNAERGEAGITLYLMTEAAGSLSGGVGGGKDYWPGFFDENDPARSVNIGNNRRMTPNFRLGMDLTATAAGSQRAGVVFRVADEDIDQFVDDLFEGKVNPLQVLQKAADHETYEARRFNFDITAGANADLRVGFGLSETGSDPLSAVARLGIAASVTVNLLTYTDYSLEQNNDKVHLREGGKNRPRLLNTLIGAFGGRAQLSGTHTNPGPLAQPGTQSAANNMGVTVTGTVDSRTTKRVKFRYQVAQPMTTKTLDKLSDSLKGAYKDAASKAALAALADPLDPRYVDKSPEQAIQSRLDGLTAFVAERPSRTDAQYKAVREVKRAAVQHEASANNHSVLENARFESNYTNLSRLDEQSMITSIVGSVKELSNPSNASRVADLMERDPKLKALLKGMQASEGTLARVRLEPKDSLIDDIDEGSRAGTMTQGELASRLENRNDMRIRALTVFHTATQPENFTSPTPLVSYNSGASLSVTKTVGRIVFQYGEDQDTPIGYTFDGEQSRPSENLKEAANALNQAGLVLKS